MTYDALLDKGSAFETQRRGPHQVPRSALHSAILDPKMDSMRVLSETALAFPDALSFSSGAPYDGDYDLPKISHYVERYFDFLRESGVAESQITRRMFHYGPVSGFIQAQVAQMLQQDENIDVPARSIVLTNGFQEALLLALRGLFKSADDVLLAVAPAYVGVLGAARMLDIPVHGVTEGPAGLEPTAVLSAIHAVRAQGRHATALYLIPDFSNPSGTVIPLEARRKLLEMAEEEEFTILEDNPYGLFAREGEELPTLKSLDEKRRVVYLGSFAKSAFPGARLGYVVADQLMADSEGPDRYLAEELATAKAMFSVGTSSLSQALIGGMLEEHGYDLRAATRPSRDAYLQRLDAVLTALRDTFPPEDHATHGVSWNSPSGGFFVVIHVPFPTGLELMEQSAREYGVSWAPMNMFYAEDGGEKEIRLGISNLSPQDIRMGIARLARFITDQGGAALNE